MVRVLSDTVAGVVAADPQEVTATTSRRQAEIDALDALDVTTLSPDLRALLELAVAFCGVRSGALNVITEDHQHQIAAVGLEPTVCTSAESMCAIVLDQPTLAVGDARDDPRFASNPFVDGRLDDVRFYASAPLATSRGVVIGRLCVFDPAPRTLTGDQEDALRLLADRVIDVLELRRRERELQRSNEMLAEFAAQVGHDLRSPLTSILFQLELAQAEPEVVPGSALHTLLGRTAEATRRMGALVEGILRSARHDLPLQRGPVDLGLVLVAVLDDLAAAVDTGGATVTRGDLHVVDGDPAQVHALLLNLVSNALKFTRAGRPAQVHVSSRRVGGSWVVEVADEGRGVPPEALRRVFDRFERVAEPSVDAAGGTGIGLATVRRIAEGHGGSVSLHPRADVTGTVARVTLPALSG